MNNLESVALRDSVTNLLDGLNDRLLSPEDESAEFLDVKQTLKEVLNQTSHSTNVKISFTAKGKQSIYFNRDRLWILLTNLIQNATKSIGEGKGKIEITSAKIKDRWQLEVSNDGEGSFGIELFFVEQIAKFYGASMNMMAKPGRNRISLCFQFN